MQTLKNFFTKKNMTKVLFLLALIVIAYYMVKGLFIAAIIVSVCWFMFKVIDYIPNTLIPKVRAYFSKSKS